MICSSVNRLVFMFIILHVDGLHFVQPGTASGGGGRSALHRSYIPFGGTFLTFSDYSRNALQQRELAQERPRFGLPRLRVLLRREGLVQNHKRVKRRYRPEGLSQRLKPRKRSPRHWRVVMPTPNGADESWACCAAPLDVHLLKQ